MTRTARHAVTHAGLDEAVYDSLDQLARAVARVVRDPRTSAPERRATLAAFRGALLASRAACLDAYRIDAGLAMVKAVAHTCRLTEDVAETLRHQERDLARIEAIPLEQRLAEWFGEAA